MQSASERLEAALSSSGPLGLLALGEANPCGKSLGVPELMERREHLNERVLDEVIGAVNIVDESPRRRASDSYAKTSPDWAVGSPTAARLTSSARSDTCTIAS